MQIYLHIHLDEYNLDNPTVAPFNTDMSAYGYILIGTLEVDVSAFVPDRTGLTQLLIEKRETEKNELRAQTFEKLEELDARIQTLRALPAPTEVSNHEA